MSPAVMPADGGRLFAGAAVAPPQGLIDYCGREASDCGNDGGDANLRGRYELEISSLPVAAVSKEVHAPSLFQAMMFSRISASSTSAPIVSQRHEVALTAQSWHELQAVNLDINRRIIPTTDEAQYGVEEFWARPLLVDPRRGRGDCEDYALEKRARLLALGWPADALALAVAMAPGVGMHATLIVQTDHGDVVLDNLHDRPRPIASLDYIWISRQEGASMANWTSAQLADATGRPEISTATPEGLFQSMMRARTQLGATMERAASRTGDDAPQPEPLPFVDVAPSLLPPNPGFARTGFFEDVDLTPDALRARERAS